MKTSVVAAFVLSAFCISGNALAYEKGNILIRGGITTVAPNESSGNIFLADTDLGIGLTIDNDTQLGLNVAYFIADHLNVELLAATPFKHNVSFSVSDPLGTGDKLGEVTHLPPTLTVNYYPNNPAAVFQPYIGAGINYTLIYDERFSGANQDAGLADLSLDNSFGLSAQVGADVVLSKNWHINASVRWIDIDTDASFSLSGTKGSVSDISIDPWVYTVSLGYTF